MTVAEVMDTVERDAGYYRRTGGGMTLSGGESLVQWQFASETSPGGKEKRASYGSRHDGSCRLGNTGRDPELHRPGTL